MPIREISEQELDALILRMEEAIENDLSITKEDMKLWLEIGLSFAQLQERLSDNDVTLHKLKKLAGLVKSSEKLSNITDKDKADKPEKQKSSKEKEEKVVEHKECNHKLEDLSKGEVCPKCGKGKLYKYEPAITVRVSGNSPLVSTKHIRERLRCNTCGEYFTAELPQEVKNDGGEDNHYTYSAKAIMAIYRYFGGLPLHRQESMGNLLGVPINASTILDQTEHVANAGNVIFNYLKKLAGSAKSYQLDDTKNRIVGLDKEMIPNRKTGKLKERSGIYTSGIIAEIEGNYKIVLIKMQK